MTIQSANAADAPLLQHDVSSLSRASDHYPENDR